MFRQSFGLRLLLVSSFLAMIILVLCSAKPNSNARRGQQHRGKPGRGPNSENVEKIKAHCTADPETENKCKGQKKEHVKRRGIAKKVLLELAAFEDDVETSEVEEVVERRLLKIQELKKAWYRRHGIEDIDPADDGLWQRDVILTEDQAEAMIAHLEAAGADNDTSSESPGPSRLRRSASTFFEQNSARKWSMPIHFWISSSFSKTQKDWIRSALSTITAAAPCIKFVEDSSALKTGNQVQYRQIQDDFCGGFATIGRWGIQSVNLRFCSRDSVGQKGVIMHETIHALGGHHEQSRVDRDEFVEILYDNIDPQEVYNYDKELGTTSYGVAYDYRSIMHYQNGDFAMNEKLPTMRPLSKTVSSIDMGGDVLTASDKLQLNRMYCRPDTCSDRYVDCGDWADEKWCADAGWSKWMKTNCGKSCGSC